MLTLIDVEEYFRNRRIKNREKIFNSVQKALNSINTENNGSDGTIYALAIASDYNTLYFTLNRTLGIIKQALRTEKERDTKNYYKHGQIFFGFLKFVLDFYGGYLGFLWL